MQTSCSEIGCVSKQQIIYPGYACTPYFANFRSGATDILHNYMDTTKKRQCVVLLVVTTEVYADMRVSHK